MAQRSRARSVGSSAPTTSMPPHTAPDLRDARLYALLHRGNAGDIEFYLERCQRAQHVLELGVGFGRIAVPLLGAGVAVTGIDNHAGLLELSVQRAGELGDAARFDARLADMRSFDLGTKFDRILIPYSGLFCLLDADSVQACLARCREHLAPGGRLLFDVYEADSFHEACDPRDFDESIREHVVDVVDGQLRLSVFESSRWDKPAQRLDMTYEYVGEQGHLLHTSLVRQRYWLIEQFAPTLVRAGFDLAALHGGFEGEPPGTDAAVIVVEAKPA